MQWSNLAIAILTRTFLYRKVAYLREWLADNVAGKSPGE